MGKKLAFGLGLAVIIVAALAGYLYLQGRVFYPVVRIALADGLSITAVLPETKERNACAAAGERFTAPFRQCKDCKVLGTRCDAQLEGMELAMRQGAPVPHP